MITLIVARDQNGAIGKDGDIPWHAPEDLKFFMRETTGGAVIMGRNTWDSLPVKPLKNRLNIVVSSQGVDHEHVVPSISDAIALAHSEKRVRIYGMGGARLYEEMLSVADRLLITQVSLSIEEPDTWFPEVDLANWQEVGRVKLQDGPTCEAIEYLRLRS